MNLESVRLKKFGTQSSKTLSFEGQCSKIDYSEILTQKRDKRKYPQIYENVMILLKG